MRQCHQINKQGRGEKVKRLINLHNTENHSATQIPQKTVGLEDLSLPNTESYEKNSSVSYFLGA